MAIITNTALWTFDSNTQNWFGVSVGTNGSINWSAQSASLSSSIGQNNVTVRSMTGSWAYTASWSDILGYTPGQLTSSTIVGLSASYSWQVPRKGGAGLCLDGPFELRSSGSLLGTIISSTAFTTTSNRVWKSGGIAITSQNIYSRPTLALSMSLVCNGGSGTTTYLLQDTVSITASIEEIYSTSTVNGIVRCSGFFFP
jgi:hypothetical protein